MKMFVCKFAQDEVTHQRLRVCSKKSVQQGRSHFDAQSVCGIREHGKMATCRAIARRSASAGRREAAPAKTENAAGGFFQQTPTLLDDNWNAALIGPTLGHWRKKNEPKT